MPGTWVTVPTGIISELEWMNLHEDGNYSRQFSMLYSKDDPPIRLSFCTREEPIDSLRRWLSDCEHEQLYEPLKSYGVTNIADLEGFDVCAFEG